jgi:hypothetical protein
MHIRILALNQQAKQYEVGRIRLQDGALVTIPATDDEGDHRCLLNLSSKPMYVLMDGKDRIIDPATEPELFLKWAHRALTGTYVRASKAEDMPVIHVDQDPHNADWLKRKVDS